MKYFVKNDLSLILDSRYKLEDKLIVFRQGRNIKSYLAKDFTEIEVSEEKRVYGMNKDLFKLVDGVPKLQTITHLKAREDKKLKRRKKDDLKETRLNDLNDAQVEYDGAIFQTRPCDHINFTTTLTLMGDTDKIMWTLKDDTEKELTKADIQAVYILGLAEGARIDKTYRDAVRAL